MIKFPDEIDKIYNISYRFRQEMKKRRFMNYINFQACLGNLNSQSVFFGQNTICFGETILPFLKNYVGNLTFQMKAWGI